MGREPGETEAGGEREETRIPALNLQAIGRDRRRTSFHLAKLNARKRTSLLIAGGCLEDQGTGSQLAEKKLHVLVGFDFHVCKPIGHLGIKRLERLMDTLNELVRLAGKAEEMTRQNVALASGTNENSPL